MSDDEAVPPRRPSLGNAGGSGPQPLRALSDDEGSLVAVPRGAHYKRKGPLVAVPRGEACKSKRAAAVPGPLPGKRGFVEVCSGSDTFTSVWRDAGHAVFPVDLKKGGQSHDLATDAGAQLVCDAVARLTRDAGSSPVAHFAPPCSTYSCARRPRIRSADHPRGLPRDQLTVDQKALLNYANKVTATVFKLMEGLAADGVPHCFEQPASSLMLKDQAFRSWASRWGAQRAVVDMCQFGRPYRKRTVIWGVPSGLLDGLSKTCTCPGPHVVTLSRWGDSARSVGTEEGCSAYPRELCEHWRRVMLQNLKPMVAVHPAAGSSGGE